jgi:hypothetical protein
MVSREKVKAFSRKPTFFTRYSLELATHLKGQWAHLSGLVRPLEPGHLNLLTQPIQRESARVSLEPSRGWYRRPCRQPRPVSPPPMKASTIVSTAISTHDFLSSSAISIAKGDPLVNLRDRFKHKNRDLSSTK